MKSFSMFFIVKYFLIKLQIKCENSAERWKEVRKTDYFTNYMSNQWDVRATYEWNSNQTELYIYFMGKRELWVEKQETAPLR